ncbi:hypothetical protein DFP72DRAFT_891147 [Ephemerocybe angulata]|uniref:F-box domain-containing protein n=1 Tax=Ephemerocybe angulata TaxID=980116 RepID=A0A8H6I3V8_9AGAR|nr:hypothetical protein DFP72DRAFT_891147 [Tulosesus angulatus]
MEANLVPLPEDEELPNDVWFEVAILLEPQDLLCMKLVCRALYSIFADQELWKYVLHAVCRRHFVFLPSFPIDDMNATELQRAALGPYRWGKLLERNSRHSVKKENLALVRPMKENDYPLRTTRQSKKFLVPGGRYLVVAHTESVDLWDLGPVGRAPLSPPVLVAREELAPSSATAFQLEGLEVAPINEATLRIVVALVGSKALFSVFDISLDGENPSFKPIDSLVVETQVDDTVFCTSLSIHGNRLHATLTRYAISLIWDFKTGRWTKGRSQVYNSYHDYPTKAFTGTAVIEFGSNSLLVWAVPFSDAETAPVLQSTIYLDEELPKALGDMQEITYPRWEPISSDMTTIRLPSIWHSRHCGSLIFDILRNTQAREPENDLSCGFRYQVDVRPSPLNHTSPEKLNVAVALLATYDFPPGFSYAPMLCTTPNASLGLGHAGASMILMSTPRETGYCDDFIFSMYALRASDSPHNEDVRSDIVLIPIQKTLLSDELSPVSQSLCSASGRLAFTTWLINDPVAISVSDFLSPWQDPS